MSELEPAVALQWTVLASLLIGLGGLVGFWVRGRLGLRWRIREIEHETAYINVYRRRAEAIDELYGLLIDAHESIRDLVTLMGPSGREDQKYEQAVERARGAGQAYQSFLKRHALYLENALLGDLNEVADTLGKAFNVTAVSPSPPSHGPPGSADRWFDRWQSTFDALNDTVPALRKKIEAAMRRELGVPEN